MYKGGRSLRNLADLQGRSVATELWCDVKERVQMDEVPAGFSCWYVSSFRVGRWGSSLRFGGVLIMGRKGGGGGGSHCESVGGEKLLISGRWGGVRVYACMFVVFLYSVAIEVEAHKSVVRLAQMNSSPENCDFAAIM